MGTITKEKGPSLSQKGKSSPLMLITCKSYPRAFRLFPFLKAFKALVNGFLSFFEAVFKGGLFLFKAFLKGCLFLLKAFLKESLSFFKGLFKGRDPYPFKKAFLKGSISLL